MTLEVREVRLKTENNLNLSGNVRPVVIKWKGEPMIRSQSLGATIQEILNAVAVQDSQDVVQVNIIGPPSTGKTELSITLGHLIHKRSKIPFTVRLFQREQLIKFQETLGSLEAANHVLIFDDVSFLGADATAKQLEFVKKAVTQIRHLPGGKDVKIVIIKNFHYTLGLPKYLRANDFTYITKVDQANEIENVEKIVGSKNMGKVFQFIKIHNKIKVAEEGQKKFHYKLGKREGLTYSYKQPFIPVLYWNGDSLRHIVSPKRTWIDPVCSICEQFTTNQIFKNDLDLNKFKYEASNIWGESTLKTAIAIKLKEQGINVLRPKLAQALKWLDKVLATQKVSLEQMAIQYELKPTKTKLKKDITEAIENSKVEDKDLIDNVIIDSVKDG